MMIVRTCSVGLKAHHSDSEVLLCLRSCLSCTKLQHGFLLFCALWPVVFVQAFLTGFSTLISIKAKKLVFLFLECF